MAKGNIVRFGLLPAILFAATILSSPASADAPEPPAASPSVSSSEQLDKAREIVEIMFPPAKRRELFSNIFAAITNMMQARTGSEQASDDPGLNRMIKRHTDNLMREISADLDANSHGQFDAIAKAYSRRFSDEELTEILKFAQTPAGSNFLQKSQSAIQDPDVVEWNAAFARRVQAITEVALPNLEKEIKDYVEKENQSDEDSVS